MFRTIMTGQEYTIGSTPWWYICSVCEIDGVQLRRQFGHTTMYCNKCYPRESEQKHYQTYPVAAIPIESVWKSYEQLAYFLSPDEIKGRPLEWWSALPVELPESVEPTVEANRPAWYL